MKIFSLFLKLYKTFPKRIPFILCLIFLSALFEFIGLGILVPIIEFFFEDRHFVGHSYISTLFYSVAQHFNISLNLFVLFACLTFFFCLKSVIKFFESYFTFRLSQYYRNLLSTHFFNSILKSKWLRFQSKPIGFYQSIFTNEISGYVSAIQLSLFFISDCIQILFYFILSLIISWKLSLFVFFFLGLSFLAFKRFYIKSKQVGSELRERLNDYTNFTVEHLGLIKWIKLSANETACQTHFEKKLYRFTNKQFFMACLTSVLPAFSLSFLAVSLSVICYMALAVFKLEFSAVIILIGIILRSLPKFQSLQQRYQAFLMQYPNIQCVDQMTQLDPQHYESTGTVNFSELTTHIIVDHLSFSYTTQSTGFQIQDVSFTIPKNHLFAIVGPSGSGKSTITDLLTGLLSPTNGTIRFDDRPLAQYNLVSLRQHIGVISQDILLLNDSIRTNLTWGQDDLDETTVHQALKQAYCLEFIDQLDDGLDTVIGDRGLKLSGGQRQRLGLARALIANPSILILDEATSSLDAESEHFIHQNYCVIKRQ